MAAYVASCPTRTKNLEWYLVHMNHLLYAEKAFCQYLTFSLLFICTPCKKRKKIKPTVDVSGLPNLSQFPCKLSTVQTRESTKGCYVHMYQLLFKKKNHFASSITYSHFFVRTAGKKGSKTLEIQGMVMILSSNWGFSQINLFFPPLLLVPSCIAQYQFLRFMFCGVGCLTRRISTWRIPPRSYKSYFSATFLLT